MTLPDPVIVVPGITASSLRDTYPLPPEAVWQPLSKAYRRIILHPDDLAYELQEPSMVSADHVFQLVYGEMVSELRHELSDYAREQLRAGGASDAEVDVPVYPFAYDWRQPLEQIQKALATFVTTVIKKTKLMRPYHNDGYAKRGTVSIIAHSMGGLIAAGYIADKGPRARVSKVVSLASPFRGSLEAVRKMLTGKDKLSRAVSGGREREAARVTPSLYYLLPAFKGALHFDGKPNATLLRSTTWQPNVIESLDRYVRQFSLQDATTRKSGKQLFQELLDAAAAHRKGIEKLDLVATSLQSTKNWLCVVGVDSDTRVTIRASQHQGQPIFDLGTFQPVNHYGSRSPAARVQTGDGTVPYEGARSNFIPLEQVVCVTADDYGFWEWEDRTLNAAAGLHSALPTMNMVVRLTVAHLTGRGVGRYQNIWGRSAPDLPKGAQWDPPIAGLANKA